MRIVSGRVGGLRIQSPPGSVRPTTDRVREAIFSGLESMGVLAGARVADLFAGSGALGLEALSRGAASAVFVDRDARAVSIVRSNLGLTGLTGSGEVVCGEVVAWLGGARRHFEVAFADPPYAFDRWEELLAVLDSDLLVAESDREVTDARGGGTGAGEASEEAGERTWETVRSRHYGGTVVTVIRRTVNR